MLRSCFLFPTLQINSLSCLLCVPFYFLFYVLYSHISALIKVSLKLVTEECKFQEKGLCTALFASVSPVLGPEKAFNKHLGELIVEKV